MLCASSHSGCGLLPDFAVFPGDFAVIVPEPATAALLGPGLLALAAAARRR